MVTYTHLLSSDALLKYFNPVPANPGPPADAFSTSAHPSDVASGLHKNAAPIDPTDWPCVLTDKVRTEFILRGTVYSLNTHTSWAKECTDRLHQSKNTGKKLV